MHCMFVVVFLQVHVCVLYDQTGFSRLFTRVISHALEVAQVVGATFLRAPTLLKNCNRCSRISKKNVVDFFSIFRQSYASVVLVHAPKYKCGRILSLFPD